MTEEMAEYVSKNASLGLILKKSKKFVLDGEVIREQGIHIKFTGGRFKTDDPETIDLMDKLLNGKGGAAWNRMFQKVPSKRVREQAAKLGRKIKEEQDKVAKRVREEMKVDATVEKETNKFQDFLDKTKNESTKVKPTKDKSYRQETKQVHGVIDR